MLGKEEKNAAKECVTTFASRSNVPAADRKRKHARRLNDIRRLQPAIAPLFRGDVNACDRREQTGETRVRSALAERNQVDSGCPSDDFDGGNRSIGAAGNKLPRAVLVPSRDSQLERREAFTDALVETPVAAAACAAIASSTSASTPA